MKSCHPREESPTSEMEDLRGILYCVGANFWIRNDPGISFPRTWTLVIPMSVYAQSSFASFLRGNVSLRARETRTCPASWADRHFVGETFGA